MNANARLMTRRQIVRRLVQNEICDDYENIDQIILPHVRKDASTLGLTIDRADVPLDDSGRPIPGLRIEDSKLD